MIVIGLTGSLAMGKSTAATMLRRLGLPLQDADRAVHRLLGPGGAAVGSVAAAFPDSLRNDAIDRQALGAQVFGNPAALDRLEGLLHPLVRLETLRFIALKSRQRRPMVVLDIPLLFETGGEALCDAVILVTAPEFLQRQRALRRPGMTPEKLAGIRDRQMPEAQKRRRANFVVQTGLGKGYTQRALAEIVRQIGESTRGR